MNCVNKKIKIADAFSKYVPYNFVFVISSDKNGKPNGMVAAWHTKCSHEPPIMAVCIDKKQNTHRLIKESGEFVLAVPGRELLPAIKVFGEMHGDKIDKFSLSKIKKFKIKNFKTPLLSSAVLNFACKVVKSVSVGDHTMFIGQVEAAFGNDEQKILLSYGKKNGKRVFKLL